MEPLWLPEDLRMSPQCLGRRQRGRKTGWPIVLCLTPSSLPPPSPLPGPASPLGVASHSWARGRKGTFWIPGVLRAELLGEGLFLPSSCTGKHTAVCFRVEARSHGSHPTLARLQPSESLLGLTSSPVNLLGHSCDKNKPAGVSGIYKEQMKIFCPHWWRGKNHTAESCQVSGTQVAKIVRMAVATDC